MNRFFIYDVPDKGASWFASKSPWPHDKIRNYQCCCVFVVGENTRLMWRDWTKEELRGDNMALFNRCLFGVDGSYKKEYNL